MSRITIKPFPQSCTITSDKLKIDSFEGNVGAEGYKIFNKDNKLIGIVLADTNYEGRGVIRFLNDLKKKYGVWHLIQKNYSFVYLQNIILKNGYVNIDIN